MSIRNQFHSVNLTTVAAKQLCAPASKTRAGRNPAAVPEERSIDHFTCYSVRQARLPRAITVRTVDQFGRRRMALRQINQLCLPTAKNNEPIEHPVDHLVCYSGTDPAAFRERRMRTRDQFGTRDVDVDSPAGFCVPSVKRG